MLSLNIPSLIAVAMIVVSAESLPIMSTTGNRPFFPPNIRESTLMDLGPETIVYGNSQKPSAPASIGVRPQQKQERKPSDVLCIQQQRLQQQHYSSSPFTQLLLCQFEEEEANLRDAASLEETEESATNFPPWQSPAMPRFKPHSFIAPKSAQLAQPNIKNGQRLSSQSPVRPIPLPLLSKQQILQRLPGSVKRSPQTYDFIRFGRSGPPASMSHKGEVDPHLANKKASGNTYDYIRFGKRG